MEKYVLGVDAAWTNKNPSGVALLKWASDTAPKLVKTGRSYDEFCNGERQDNLEGSMPNFSDIIGCCPQVDLIALDIPLSPHPIVKRRNADNIISHEYGKFKVSTHSPSPKRPGVIATNIFDQLKNNGFEWACEYKETPAFIEVYPHVAIIEFFGYEKRFPYKIQKRAKYWPNDSSEERYHKIISKLNELRNKLTLKVDNIKDFLPLLDSNTYYKIKCLKGYEDLLDGVLSALVGCNFLDRKAEPKGDPTGVIWTPKN